MVLLCVGSSVKKCHRHVQLVDMSDEPLASQCAQHCSDERNFADSSEACSGNVIVGLVLSLVFTQERQDNRPQHLIYVRLTD